jgi:hypothetical protein
MKILRYKKLIIKNNALVPKGAMEVLPVYKEDDGKFRSKSETIFKANDEKLELTTVMVKFGKVDADNMILDDEAVRDEAMIDFMKNGNKRLVITHNTEDEKREVNAYIKELYVAKGFDSDFSEYEGSILSTAKFDNVEDYTIAKELQLETSIEGMAELEEVILDKSLKDRIVDNLEYFVKYFGLEKIKELIGEEMFGNNKELKEKYEALEKEFVALKEQLDNQINENLEFKNKIETFEKDQAISEVSNGLVMTQTERLRKLSEGIDSSDIDEYKRKLKILRETHFDKKGGKKVLTEDVQEVVSDSPDSFLYVGAY